MVDNLLYVEKDELFGKWANTGLASYIIGCVAREKTAG